MLLPTPTVNNFQMVEQYKYLGVIISTDMSWAQGRLPCLLYWNITCIATLLLKLYVAYVTSILDLPMLSNSGKLAKVNLPFWAHWWVTAKLMIMYKLLNNLIITLNFIHVCIKSQELLSEIPSAIQTWNTLPVIYFNVFCGKSQTVTFLL